MPNAEAMTKSKYWQPDDSGPTQRVGDNAFHLAGASTRRVGDNPFHLL
jgi:hypothetical protein